MTVDADPLRGNAVLVDALGSALRRGGNALDAVPDLLKRVLQEGSWREFVTQRGEQVRHERFADFVTAPPLRGIGASVDLIKRIVAPYPRVVDLLDRALQNPVGTNVPVDNMNSHSPRGTSKAYALRKLRKDAPELHARVLAEEISAHAAMVEAGFQPGRFTVCVTTPEAIARVLRNKLGPEVLAEVVRLLSA